MDRTLEQAEDIEQNPGPGTNDDDPPNVREMCKAKWMGDKRVQKGKGKPNVPTEAKILIMDGEDAKSRGEDSPQVEVKQAQEAVGTPRDKRKRDRKPQEETEKRPAPQTSRERIMELAFSATTLLPQLDSSGKETNTAGAKIVAEGAMRVGIPEVGPYRAHWEKGQWHWDMTTLMLDCIRTVGSEWEANYDQILLGGLGPESGRPGTLGWTKDEGIGCKDFSERKTVCHVPRGYLVQKTEGLKTLREWGLGVEMALKRSAQKRTNVTIVVHPKGSSTARLEEMTVTDDHYEIQS